jgi:hypothetical protein
MNAPRSDQLILNEYIRADKAHRPVPGMRSATAPGLRQSFLFLHLYMNTSISPSIVTLALKMEAVCFSETS